jgi:hypothetical protein
MDARHRETALCRECLGRAINAKKIAPHAGYTSARGHFYEKSLVAFIHKAFARRCERGGQAHSLAFNA